MRAGAKARGDELKSTLIEAALSRLATSGLQGLSIRQLAADADCGAGTIGYLFGSLDNLVLWANDRTLAEIAEAMDESLCRTQYASRADRMGGVALAYLDYARGNRHRWEALFLHRLPPGIALPDWYEARRDGLIGKVAAVLDEEGQGVDMAENLARTVFEAVHGVVLLGLEQKLGEASEIELRGRVRMLIRLLAAGLPSQ